MKYYFYSTSGKKHEVEPLAKNEDKPYKSKDRFYGWDVTDTIPKMTFLKYDEIYDENNNSVTEGSITFTPTDEIFKRLNNTKCIEYFNKRPYDKGVLMLILESRSLTETQQRLFLMFKNNSESNFSD